MASMVAISRLSVTADATHTHSYTVHIKQTKGELRWVIRRRDLWYEIRTRNVKREHQKFGCFVEQIVWQSLSSLHWYDSRPKSSSVKTLH